MLNLKQI